MFCFPIYMYGIHFVICSTYLTVDSSEISPIWIYVYTMDGNIWFWNLKLVNKA